MNTTDPETAAPVLHTEKNTFDSRSEQLLPLPLCEGPRLGPFTQNFEDLKFEPELVIKGDKNEFAHGLVIKAKLDGTSYGIKFFIESRGAFDPEHYPGLSKDEIAIARMQSDPFFTECRAYGRLQEVGAEHLTAKAYGYVQLFINEQTEKMFKPAIAMAGGVWENGLADFMDHYDEVTTPSSETVIVPRPLTQPIYGIVKEWAGGDKEHDVAWQWSQPFEEQMEEQQRKIAMLPQNLEYLHNLHKYGIVVRDLHSGQWVEGMLVDLSYSWTVPHILGQGDRNRPDWTFASYAARDLFMFQQVIDFQNEQVDFLADKLHQQGVFGPFRKSSLVSYPSSDAVLEAPKPRIPPTFRREGLRPLPHRLIQSLGEEEEDDDEEDEELPLLLYSEQYDPDSEELPKGWAAWTYGPRWDPAQFLSGKQRRQEAGPFDVLEEYIIARAMARRSRRSKMKAKSKAAAVVGEKPRAEARTKVNTKNKVTKRRKKRVKMV